MARSMLEALRLQAEAIGLPIEEEDLAALAEQLAAGRTALDALGELGLAGVEPLTILAMDRCHG